MSNRVVRCKFKVDVVHSYADGGEGLQASPVYPSAEHPENAVFSKWTPSGKFEVLINNPDCIGVLKPGQSFYLDIVPIEPASS